MPMIMTVQSEVRSIFTQIKNNTGQDFGAQSATVTQDPIPM